MERILTHNCFLGVCEVSTIPSGAKIDNYHAKIIQSIIRQGVIIGVFGIFILLTTFIKSLKKFQMFVLPKLAIVIPVLIGLAGGTFAGFSIGFDTCFKTPCTFYEQYAPILIPIFTLIITLPLTILIYKKQHKISKGISQISRLVWLVVGLLIIIYAVKRTLLRLY